MDDFEPGVLLVLIPVAVFAFFGIVIWRSLRRLSARGAARLRVKEAHARRMARAVPSTARVARSEPRLGERRDQHGFGIYREVMLTLEVQPPADSVTSTPTLTDVIWDVQTSAMPHVAPGSTCRVKVDPTDPSYLYPADAWARTTLD